MKLVFSILTFSLLLFLLSSASAITHQRITGNQKYLENRLHATDKRYASFLLALELLGKRDAKILVETGTARFGDQNFVGDGGSTIIFAHWSRDHDASFYSVDIDEMSVINAQNSVKEYSKNVAVICSDSIEFLKNFSQPIDFLYLDSYDFEFGNPLPSQQHHLHEIEAAYSKLHKDSIVMIDDCDLPHGGKGKLIIAYLLERGWKVIHEGYQVILKQ